MKDFQASLNEQLAAAGMPMHGSFLVDDKIHRFKSPPDKEDNSWYVLHQYGEIVAGAFGCWKRNFFQPFCSRDRSDMTPDDRKSMDAAVRNAKAIQQAEEKANHDKVRQKCAELFAKAARATAHGYLSKKGVHPSTSTVISNHDLYLGWLAVPLQDIDGTLHSAQFIDENGDKRFFYQGRTRGCFHLYADVNHEGPVVICEGYATGASIHQATRWTTVCAMNCGNMEIVARDFRRKYPDRTLIVAGDDDQFTEGNPGRTKATAIAQSNKALLALPEFGDEALEQKPTDFNDLHRLSGLPEVTRQIHRSMPTLRLLAERQFNPLIVPAPLQTVYAINGKTISTPGNLSSITSAIKTGKSACVCAMMSSAFPHQPDADLLSFESKNPKNLAIVHIDSEQSPDDHWHMVNRMLRRVGLDKPPPWFYSYCLTGVNFKTAYDSFIEALRLASERHQGVHSAFIDGICDLVSDPNDQSESNDFVAKLQATAISYKCPIIGVIHFNPGSVHSDNPKTRGHLGSQFERKAKSKFSEIERVLAGRPLPGSRRPSSEKVHHQAGAWIEEEPADVLSVTPSEPAPGPGCNPPGASPGALVAQPGSDPSI